MIFIAQQLTEIMNRVCSYRARPGQSAITTLNPCPAVSETRLAACVGVWLWYGVYHAR